MNCTFRMTAAAVKAKVVAAAVVAAVAKNRTTSVALKRYREHLLVRNFFTVIHRHPSI